jgi:3-hydroxyethyl bacteriochlorophyllide a dehydrogenase
VSLDRQLGERAVLLALAATAHHALNLPHLEAPDLIIGHGVLGRLLARLCMLRGGPVPTVWERDRLRRPSKQHGNALAQGPSNRLPSRCPPMQCPKFRPRLLPTSPPRYRQQ